MASNKLFKHNDLRFYIRALFDMSGIDARYLAPGYDEVPQANAQTIESVLEAEDQQNGEHMETHWLQYDRALQAVGMRESSGYNKGDSVESLHDARSNKKKDKNAYIGLARVNAERSKGHLQNVPLAFEMVANHPDEDGDTVQAVNRYREEILNQNNFRDHYNEFIADGHDFGSGILYNAYRERPHGADAWFLEERAKQGQPIEFDEYQKMQQMAKAHKICHIDTFDVIRDRRARGKTSADFSHNSHTITTWMEPITVTEAMQKFPEHKNAIKAGQNNLYMKLNPRAAKINRDDLLTTIKRTWIQCPVNYEMEYKVHVGNNIVVPKTQRKSRNAVLCITRLENAGIVDMKLDEYAHCEVPLTMWQRRASKFHPYGIGAFKDMWAAEWAYNIAFNGKFHWFNRMAKGGGFYLKGSGITDEQLQQRTQEHTWIGLDPNDMSPDLRDKGISSLIYDTRPTAFPSVYDNLEANMEGKVKDTGGWHGVSGAASGSSGRQEMILRNHAESGMEPTVANLEAAHIPLGRKFFSNIVQFDGDKHIEFNYEDPASGDTERVALNEVVGEVPEFDLDTGQWKLLPYEIRNSVKTLEYSTQISTRSIVPVNPTERRFWWLDTLSAIFPYTQSQEGVFMLQQLDRHVYNGLFRDMIEQLQEVFAQRAESQQRAMEEEQAREQRKDERDYNLEMIDREQNKYRLEQKARSDLLKAVQAFKDGDPNPMQQLSTQNPNIINQLHDLLE